MDTHDPRLVLAVVGLLDVPRIDEKTLVAMGCREARIAARDGATSCLVDGESIMVSSVVPEPIHDADLAEVKGNLAVLRGHRAHAVVAVTTGKSSALARHLALSRVTASLGGAAVLWRAASLLHDGAVFANRVRTMSDPPFDLWIDIHVETRSGETSCSTLGLSAFGHREIEVIGSQREPSYVHERVRRAVESVVVRGDVLCEGTMVGEGEEERIRVSLGRSPRSKERVAFLEL
jgi:hypothetical protein